MEEFGNQLKLNIISLFRFLTIYVRRAAHTLAMFSTPEPATGECCCNGSVETTQLDRCRSTCKALKSRGLNLFKPAKLKRLGMLNWFLTQECGGDGGGA